MQMLKDILDWVGKGNYWILHVFIIVVLTLIAALAAKLLLRRLIRRTQESTNIWDDAIVESLARPLNWFVWLMGISMAAQVALEVSDNNLLQFVYPIRRIGVILLLTWFVVSFITRAEENFRNPEYTDEPVDETTIRAIGKLLRMSVIITAALVLLQSLGYSISGVLAFGGIGGIAVGFAAKDMLANFFGGLMIYLDRPFSVGDWVRSPDQDIEGVVEDIGWRLTRIRTFERRPLYIPNATFTQISLENPSRMTNRRIKETIGIRYDDANRLPAIVEEVKQYLAGNEDIDQDQIIMVNFNAFAAYSLDFFIYMYTHTTDWKTYHIVKQRVLFEILKIIEDNGAQCAFPTSTLHVPEPVTVESHNLRNPESSAGDAADQDG